MIIKQCRVSDSIKFFKPFIMNKFGFKEYTNKNEPTVFWGAYSKLDLEIILNHKSLAIVQWAGTDSMIEGNAKAFLGKKNIKHISASAWNNKDLEDAELKYLFMPISIMANKEIKEQPLGEKIYIYTSKCNPDFYGKKIYDKLIERYGEEHFIIATRDTFKQSQLMEVYKNSFIGLRLLEHDGLSETVCELGLMGRNCIYNGNTPNSLNYNNIDDIIKYIESEYDKIGTYNKGLHDKMVRYLTVNELWLHSEFY